MKLFQKLVLELQAELTMQTKMRLFEAIIDANYHAVKLIVWT
jgi:hypothetical protein